MVHTSNLGEATSGGLLSGVRNLIDQVASSMYSTFQVELSGQAGARFFGGSLERGVFVSSALKNACVYVQPCIIEWPQYGAAAGFSVFAA